MTGDVPLRAAWPATGGQAGIWLADQHLGGSAAYNTTVAFTIEGADEAAVESAYRRLLECTPGLRVRMGLDRQGDVIQWIADVDPDVDWVTRPVDPVQGPDVDERLREVVARPFLTDGGQLCRLVAGHTPQGNVVAVLVAHHLVNDGASQVALAHRFVDALAGQIDGQVPSRYVGLVETVRKAEHRARSDDHEYWVRRVTARGLGNDAVDSCPIVDRAGSAAGYTRGRCGVRHLAQVVALARSTGASPFLVMAGSVHRALTAVGLNPLGLGVAVSVRPHHGRDDDVVGCFVNQVFLTATPAPGEPFAAFLTREVPGWREDLSRRCLPLLDLADDSQLAGYAPHLNRFTVSLRRAPEALSWRHGALRVSAELFKRYLAPRSDLAIRLIQRGQQLEYDAEWRPSLSLQIAHTFPATLDAILSGEQA